MSAPPPPRPAEPPPWGALRPGASAAGAAGGSPVDAALLRLLSEARVDEATSARSRGRWLRRQSAEEATLAAVLVDLGEAGTRVVAGVRGRGATPGVVVLVGADVVVLDTAVGEVVVPLHAVAWVRREPGEEVPVTGRRPAAGIGFGALLAELAVDRPAVSVGTRTGDRVGGELRAVGLDVVRLVDAHRGDVVVALAAIDDVLLTR